MPHYLLLSRSITYAQRMCRVLERAGITARYFRPPARLTGQGCGYAVRVSPRDLEASLRLLRQEGLEPKRAFYADSNGAYREIYA